MSLRALGHALCAATLFVAQSAHAYWCCYGLDNLAGLDFQYRMNRIQMQLVEQSAKARAKTPAPLPTVERASTTAAREMAQAYPAAQREQAARTFETLLAKYREIEDRFGIRRGDIGGALAAFIAGNLMAMRQQPSPDAHFAALVRQMREAVARDPAYRRLDPVELRRSYEQLAIVGMFMAATQMALAQQPDDGLREHSVTAARRYLATVIPGDLDRLQITADGLSQR
ncbi:hypothetical protein EV684_101333 [Rubrivivax gelatinosus]|uniref:Lipoprotein n=1 Tax=Rubrivivax gelatinosus TaxID=28068 RepID=A0A4R2MG85_RUBGE|nr:DUF6683 family protein [Rubrivivax gelatinosus]MBK1688964.1 hypothetical protein [Rubrivivax gelatinosus]TCP05461.1 hypothetical protein EV684_101333 [Rubrivivax gelatinosus]